MTTNITAFYDYLLPGLKGLTPGTNALLALREAAIELCERSRIWRYTPTAIDSVASQSTYPLTPPSGSEVSDVLWASYNSQVPNLSPASHADLDVLFPEGWRAEEGDVQYFYVTNDQELRLVKIPSEGVTGGIELEIALIPAFDATTLPDFLFANWRNEIAMGARAKLQMQKAKPWSDSAGARDAMRDFNAAIGEATYTADRSNTTAPIRTRAQYS